MLSQNLGHKLWNNHKKKSCIPLATHTHTHTHRRTIQFKCEQAISFVRMPLCRTKKNFLIKLRAESNCEKKKHPKRQLRNVIYWQSNERVASMCDISFAIWFSMKFPQISRQTWFQCQFCNDTHDRLISAFSPPPGFIRSFWLGLGHSKFLKV